jgi:hypothetical protein
MAFWDPEIRLELDEGEQVLMTCRHHWLMLLRDVAISLPLALIMGGLAFFRAIGGDFFGSDPAAAQQLDWVNILLLIGLAALVITWSRGLDLNAKKKTRSSVDLTWMLQGAMVLLGLLIWYRYQGGRILTMNPQLAQPFDFTNLVLISIAAMAFIYSLYQALDWRDDALILTNTRIVLDKDEFLVRHIQQQILLMDIQQFSMRQNTYPQVIFGYGSITLQSYSLQKINFDFATDPKKMEQRIREELNKTRKAIEPNLLRRLIAERVFDDKTSAPQRPQSKFHVKIEGQNRTGILAWLFPANPQIDEKSGQITWRPSAVYVGLIMLRPFLIWVVATIILALTTGLLGSWLWLGVLLWFLITVGCAARIFWLREEFINDVYILNKREIIDVDQRPFGPVNRRNAPIDRIQNISFDVTFIEQLLGFGTVRVQTGGSGDFTFNHVPDPRGVQAMINDYLTDFKKTAEERGLQNSIDVFREYHSLQRDKGELMDLISINASIDQKSRAVVDAYANEVAPIQIALEVRAALREQSRQERKVRMRRIVMRRREP